MYWVIGGSLLARQRIVDIVEDQRDDGTPCSALILDPHIVPLAGRPTKAFQGWRYLADDAAPPDLTKSSAASVAAMPEPMRRELRELGLL